MLVKPDGVSRGLIGQVLSRFEDKGFRLPAMKMIKADKERLAIHYSKHAGKDYYSNIEKSMSAGPIVAFIVEGDNAIAICRKMLGAMSPIDAAPGTIRGDLASSKTFNVCHASESKESAQNEINLWFDSSEIF